MRTAGHSDSRSGGHVPHWSDGNRERVRRLIAEGRMRPAGLATLPENLKS
jgi:hypothetical protein